MATINTVFQQLLCSASLPEAVNFTATGADATLEVKVYVGLTAIYTVMLDAYDHAATLYDVRSIYEQYMNKNGLTYISCDITVKEGSQTTGTNGFGVLLSDIHIDNIGTWLSSHFLTTRSAMRIPRSGKQLLSWFSAAGEVMTNKIVAIVQTASGTQVESTQTNTSTTISTAGIYSDEIEVADIEDIFEAVGELLAFTIFHGSRSITFFVEEDSGQKSFRFLNNFGTLEYVQLHADTVKKQKQESSEAKVLRQFMKYDITNSTEYELESSALPKEEGEWLGQLLLSRQVEFLTANDSWKEILVDGELEYSDSDEDECRLKMTYKYSNNIQYR